MAKKAQAEGQRELFDPAHAAVKMAAVPEVETAYHAASYNAKDMASWTPWRVSPDAALLPELDTIVARSDDLTRNNGIAAGAERTLVDNVVGPKISCKPNPDRITLRRDAEWASKWSAIVEAKFATFADTVWFDAGDRHTFHSASRLVLRTLSSAGEALALPLWDIGNQSKWKTCFQLVDPARLSNPDGKSDSTDLRGGIEVDAYGAPRAYNIRKTHPGDYIAGVFGGNEWERIPAYTPFGRARVLHIFDQERIGLTRGKPIITAVARQFKMFDGYLREELRLAVLNAMIFATLETPLDQQTMLQLFGGEEGGPINQDLINQAKEYRVQMKGGAIIPTPPGTKMNPFIPSRPANGLDSFSTVMLRYIAAGLNLPYELVFKDYSKTNYSSARAAMLEAWRYFLGLRQMLADFWWGPVFDLWFEEAVNRGEIPDCTPSQYYGNRVAWTRCKWICAGRGWVDPVKEAEAAQIRIEAGLSTLEDECAEQGKDWRNVLDQQAREFAMRRELGLPQPAAAARSGRYPSDREDETSREEESAA